MVLMPLLIDSDTDFEMMKDMVKDRLVLSVN